MSLRGWPHRAVAYLKATWRSHLLTVAVALTAMWAVNTWQTRHAPSGPAPDFTAPLMWGPVAKVPAGMPDGHPLSLNEWRSAHPGQPVALHIWAEWCPFCKMAESSVTRVAADWPVLTVASRSGDAAQVKRFMAQRGLPWAASVDPRGDISKTYRLSAVPAWVVLDAEGRISSITTGYTTELGMRARLWWASW